MYRASNSGIYGKMYHLINDYDAKTEFIRADEYGRGT